MEETRKKPSPSLAMHKGSQMISKSKPKIRIIHIFAPEIIKTDVANFRELVQRLTGKPPVEKNNNCSNNNNNRGKKVEPMNAGINYPKRDYFPEIWNGCGSEQRLFIKEEAEDDDEDQDHQQIYNYSPSPSGSGGSGSGSGGGEGGGGFLGAFTDLEYGFMQELGGGDFSLIPSCLGASSSSQMDAFAEPI